MIERASATDIEHLAISSITERRGEGRGEGRDKEKIRSQGEKTGAQKKGAKGHKKQEKQEEQEEQEEQEKEEEQEEKEKYSVILGHLRLHPRHVILLLLLLLVLV